MEDLSKYRLHSMIQISEIRAKIGAEKFDSFRTAVFENLKALKPGDRYDIAQNVRPSNQGVFILLSCEYMVQSGRNCNIEIDNDWTAINGVQSVHDYLLELKQIRRRRQLRNRFYEKTE